MLTQREKLERAALIRELVLARKLLAEEGVVEFDDELTLDTIETVERLRRNRQGYLSTGM